MAGRPALAGIDTSVVRTRALNETWSREPSVTPRLKLGGLPTME